MQIKKMPEAERPQEKMLYGGAGGLSNSELLALIIREDYVIAPTGETILHPNDTLVVIADTAVIRKVKSRL